MRDPHQLVLEQLHAHRFLKADGARRLNDFHRRLAELFPGHRAVVQFVRVVPFGRGPETVPAADHPFLFTRTAHLLGQFDEDILARRERRSG